MKKIQLFTIIAIIVTFKTFGQSNVSQLESENATLKSELTKKDGIIMTQNEEIIYFKKTLDLMSSQITSKNKDVTFKINSVIGNSNSGKVTIEGVLINKGKITRLQTQKAQAYDPKGNGFSTYKMSIGDAVSIPKLLKDVPTKFIVEFEQIADGTPMIKALILNFYAKEEIRSANFDVVFKNLNISWE